MAKYAGFYQIYLYSHIICYDRKREKSTRDHSIHRRDKQQYVVHDQHNDTSHSLITRLKCAEHFL